MLINAVDVIIWELLFWININNHININKNNTFCLTRKQKVIQCHVYLGSGIFKPNYFIHFKKPMFFRSN